MTRNKQAKAAAEWRKQFKQAEWERVAIAEALKQTQEVLTLVSERSKRLAGQVA